MFRLGKLAPKPAPLKLGTFLTGKLPEPPAHANLDALDLWDAECFGNDTVGDCAIAGPAHETLFWERHNGRDAADITVEDVLGWYADITGYDPSDPSTDQGSVVADVVRYRRVHGLVDSKGTAHRIATGLGVSLTPEVVKQAINLFDVCGLGIQVPASLMEQTGQAQKAGVPHVWTVVEGSPIEGGHYVAALAYDEEFLYVNSWGLPCRMSWDFLAAYADEAWAYASEEDVNGHGVSPDGIDWATLRKEISLLPAA